ncbi:2OG-Fe dioxygenase family protein [Actinoplanes sp. NPDC049548]|uniref:2OG-Fe dioxygenase family protein n=1 Tax=Actinoplanes sp. NPDC049548 TaxID=3155152 RepID=UPI00341619AE
MDKINTDLLHSFGDLPPDDYLRTAVPFRFRAFGPATMRDRKLDWTDDAQDFLQSEAINSYAGGRPRRFAPLSTAARVFAERLVDDENLLPVPLGETVTVGCHQIRIVADDDFNGYPAPEGFHRDGFDWVVITCVGQCNVNGGISMVSLPGAEQAGELLVERSMAAGETMVLNDRAVRHYVSPITPKLPGRAHRDVIVLTFDGVRAA